MLGEDMKRKIFLKKLSLGLAASVFFPANVFSLGQVKNALKDTRSGWLKTSHEGDDFNTAINCSAIEGNIKIFHIADSHISVLNNGKSEYPQFSARMDGAYLNPEHYLTGQKKTKLEHFDEILKKARDEKADLLLLTGDILNNPSVYGVEYLLDKLEQTGIEYLYTAGNHDWHFEGMKGSADELRNEWINKRLLPLYKGNNPLYYSKIINGINFVMIDDSTYQISKEQLNFFRQQATLGYPIVLSLHIPLYQPEDQFNNELYTIGDPRWGFDYDRENYITERRERWSVEGNRRETIEFLLEVVSCKNLIAVLAGHDHSAMNKKLSPSANMYLTKASYSGAHRLIEIKK